MAKLNLIINDELDKEFRLGVSKRLGMKKGNLTKAVEEALELWLNSNLEKEKS